MEVQQLQALQAVCLTQHINQLKHLCGSQAEFGFFTAAGLPFAGALRSQTRPHTQARHHIKIFGFFKHHRNFRHFFNHKIDFVTEFLAHQGKTDILTVFIAVADDDTAGHTCVRQYCHQLGFGTGFQPQRLPGIDQGFNHAPLLVNLNRINQKIITFVTIRFAGTTERGIN